MPRHLQGSFLFKATIIKILFVVSFAASLNAQVLESGCAEARFGIDADTRANISYFGNEASPTTITDDWFRTSGSPGIGVLDTVNGWQIYNAIQNGENAIWVQGMAYPQNSVVNGVRLHDASYAKDFFGGSGATDYTSFAKASKNGEDPAIWDDGPHNVLGKNDLIDCYAHLRRDGITTDDHLWMYLGFSRIANTGSSYFDAELYVETINYDPANGFDSGGPDDGHTAWAFDAYGNIIKVGDLVTTCDFSTNNAPVLSLRIWVSRYDFQNTTPQTFTFNGDFNGDGNGATYGYADIQIPANSLYGCGLGNPSVTPGPPWGTLNTSGDYSTFYEENQFVEVGLDLTVFGVDPVFLFDATGGSLCELPFSNIMFKARASSSFTAQLKDFAGPFPFNYTTELPVSIAGNDTLNCYHPIIELSVDNPMLGSFYTWYTEDGNILTDPSESLVSIDQPGTYIIDATFSEGCEGGKDTIVIVENFIYPSGVDITFDVVYGCGIATSLMAHPDGLSYFWTGPDEYTNTAQDVHVTEEGVYYLEVLNVISGCTTSDSIYVVGTPCQDELPDNITTTVMLDTIPPDFTVPVDLTIDCNADPLDLSLTGEVTNESDDCDPAIGEATFTDIVSENYPCSGSILIQRQWTLTDNCGNVNMQIQIITLEDTTPPTFFPPADISLDCEEDINDFSLTGQVTSVGDDCDAGTVETAYSDVSVEGTCSGSYTVVRTFIATDDCGNTTTAEQIITLIDNVSPIFTVPQDVTIECDQDPNDLSLTGDVFNESDNCNGNVGNAVYTDVLLENTPCSGAGEITRTWSLTDACGNVTTAIQIITLEDTTPPVLELIRGDQPYVECDTLLPIPVAGIGILITDNCDPNVDVVFTETTLFSECPDKYVIRRVWVATDACNNQDSIVQLFQVQDTENPVVVVLPDDLTLECDETIPDGNVLVDDNCSDEVTFNFVENITPGNCVESYVIERIWTWEDNCGNAETHIQLITIEDTTAPNFTGLPDVTLNCGDDPSDLNLTGEILDESDNCDLELEATYVDEVTTSFPCEGATHIKRLWTLVDGCGNITTDVQEIEILDTTPPVFTTPENFTISCDQNINDLTITGDVIDESDDCSINVGEATYVDSLSLNSGCDGEMIVYRFWALVDGCGNATIDMQVITIVDTAAPWFVPPFDLTLDCNDDPYDLTVTGTLTNIGDNCSSGVWAGVFTDSLVSSGLCEQNISIYRRWSIEDACGNDTSHIQIIHIQDVTAPVFAAPADVTLECGDDIFDLEITGEVISASDDCNSNLGEATYADQSTGIDICGTGMSIQRTWTMTDACGNSSTNIQVITIDDITPPLFTVPVEVTLDCSLDPTDLTLTGDVINENDDCDQNIGEATYTDVVSDLGVCTGASLVTRTWSLTDACGNATTEVQMINLVDNTEPTFLVPADIALECGENPFDLSITGDVFNEGDDCTPNIGEAIYNDSIRIDSAVCLQNLVILRTWVLVDGCGNGTVAVQTITVEDTHEPTMTVPDNITLDCGVDVNDLALTGEVIDVSDACDGDTITAVYADSIVLGVPCLGATKIYRKWTAVDLCGNENVAIQEIILQDTFPPVFVSVPADTTVNCDAIPVAPSELIVTDSCGGDVNFSFTETMIEGVCVDIHYLKRTWTAVDGCGNSSMATQEITVVNCSPEVSTSIDGDTTICAMEPIKFEVSVGTGYDTPTYQWQISVDGGVNWQNIPGANDAFYSILAVAEIDNGIYRCLTAEESTGLVDELCHVVSDEIILSVLPLPTPTLIDTSICEGMEILMGGNTYALTGNYLDTLPGANGCDSMIQLNLTIHPVYAETRNEVVCDGETYAVGDSIYTQSGTYTTTMSTVNNCDSIVVLELTVNPAYNETISESICEGETYTVGTTDYSTTGTHTTTLQTVAGCDSIVNLSLTVTPIYNETILESICEGEEYIVGTTTYTTSGVHITTLSTVDNCDSIIILNLTVDPVYTETRNEVVCDGETYAVGDSIYTQSGTYTTTMSTVNNCDSIVVLELVVNPVYNETISESICEGGTYTVGTTDYSTTGTHTTTLQTVAGCDSIVNLSLTVNPIYSIEIIESICEGETYTVGSADYTTTGSHTTILQTVAGCDSIVGLNLTVHPIYEETITESICEGDVYVLGDSIYTTSGDYTHILSTVNSCDSIVHLSLVVSSAYEGVEAASICLGESYT